MKWSKLAVPALIPFALSGCLDLGGSSSKEPSGFDTTASGFDTTAGVDTVSYTGSSTPATLSTDNVEGVIHSIESSGLIEEVALAFEDVFENLSVSSIRSSIRNVERYSSRYSQTGENPLTGDCGGTLDYSEQTNSATITLDNFCSSAFFSEDVIDVNLDELEVTVNGVIEMTWSETATTDTEYLVLKNFSMIAKDGDNTELHIKVGGNVIDVWNDESSSGKATYNVVLTSVLDDLEFKFVNFVEESGYEGSNFIIEVNGRIFHSDLGYYDVKTLDTMVISTEEFPTEGKIEFKGANTLTMTFNDTVNNPEIEVE